MQNYELLFVLPGTLSDDEAKPLVEKVKQVVEESGATSLELKELGKSRLAYPMKHIRYGYFNIIRFQAEGQQVETIKAKLRLVSELLRALVGKYDPKASKEAQINFGVNTGYRSDEPRSQGEEMANVAANVRTVKVEEEKKEAFVQSSLRGDSDFGELSRTVEPGRGEKEIVKTPSKKADKKVNLDDIDKKLDEILDLELDKV